MAFPSSPSDGQQATVGNVVYQYSTTKNAWTRVLGAIGTFSASGNITGGNLVTAGIVTATGNITGSYFIGNGSQLTGIAAGYANSDVAAYLASGTDSSNIITTGNISGTYILGNGSQLTGLPAGYSNATAVAYGEAGWAGNIIPSANVTYNLGSPTRYWKSLYVSGNTIYLGNTTLAVSGTGITVGGNAIVTADPTGTASTTGNMQVVGNVTGNNFFTAGVVSATGNITGNVFIGNGSQLTGLPASYTNSNVATYLSSGTVSTNILTTAAVSATGNVTGGNLTTTGAANIGGFFISGNTITASGPTLTIDPNGSGGTDGLVVIAGNLQVQGNATYINSNNITTNDLTINMANNAATASAANGGGIGVGPAGSEYISLTYNSSSNIWVASNGLSVQGVVQTAANVSGGNVLTGGQVSATGNVYGNVVVGNGAGLTSLTGTNVTGTVANATYAVSAGSAVGTAATVTTNAQPNITTVGTLTSVTVTGNVNSGNVSASGGIILGVAAGIPGQTLITGGNIFSTTTLNGNSTINGGTISAAGNVTGGNLFTAGQVSATGNVTGNYFVGNGSQLTGISAGSANGPVNITTTLVSANYTIANGQNGISVGPMTYANNVQVSVAPGQRWIIL